MNAHPTIRRDLQNALRGDIDLMSPHRFPRRQDLTVQVGQTDPVVVDELQRANP